MKKIYSVSLDKEIVDYVKPYLKKSGIPFSAYLNSSLIEYKTLMEDLDSEVKDVGNITMVDFINTFQRMMKGIKK